MGNLKKNKFEKINLPFRFVRLFQGGINLLRMSIDHCSTIKRAFFASILFLTYFLSISTYAQNADSLAADPEVISQGESLFKANCSACHRMHEQLVGPPLANISERRPLDWINAFIRNSQQVIQSGDQYAVDLFNEYNQTVMTPFDFSDEELNSILAYIKSESEKGPEVAQAADTTAEGAPAGDAATVPDTYITAILIGLVVILVIMLVILIMIIQLVRRYVTQKEDLEEADREVVEGGISLVQVLRSKATLGIVVFIFTAIVLKAIIDGLYDIGIQQGYAPVQPIAFSHQIHAGDFEIDCQYCHTGVEKSKNANIPSPNICMNCHSSILTESPEVQKIYKAVEENQPIEWVRVHNLPDLAYFNHAQHFNVGDIECETCHGPVQEMDVVRQHSLLTMGWCVDCHRTQEVNSRDNEYYDKLLEYHNEKTTDPMTVEDIGGLECNRCHY